MDKSLENMYGCLSHHPAISDKVRNDECIKIFIGSDTEHSDIAQKMHVHKKRFDVKSDFAFLEKASPDDIKQKISDCDLFIFLYASSTLKNASPQGPEYLTKIRSFITESWKKSVNKGNSIVGYLEKGHKWTSIDGSGNIDVIPGEIASHIKSLNGSVSFSGTFLSTAPFAIKYGVVNDMMTINIKEGEIIGFDCENDEFSQDFNLYLNHNHGNRIVEEFGIGTNMGVKALYGRNAGFEERHPGLHLGLGGGVKGSHHLDLIFSGGKIAFDQTVFFDNGYVNDFR
ncbi:leucyl aminopeptidase [Photorhabdus bodei]|uniref:leucyl aminopeptidase n=1 Tax=Photorhabdus bodei TaxID=2029681 RepID=UPI0023314245|nr:leucyl aminopeptidase [Photorhabdus bodei]MDB6369277.1 leucyl aminopeptidase [Photorhabdus bodei]